jgi:hypothetical protein
MAKAKTPTTKPAKARMKTTENLLQMPEGSNGSNAPQYSPADLEAEIRLRAYVLYQQRGCTPGQEEQDWITAEREVRARHDHHKHTA